MSWYWQAGMMLVVAGVIYILSDGIGGWLVARRKYYIGRYEALKQYSVAMEEQLRQLQNDAVLTKSLHAKAMNKQKLKHDFEIKRMQRAVQLMSQESQQ